MKKCIIGLLLFCFVLKINSQAHRLVNKDSLKKVDIQILVEDFENYLISDPEVAKVYADVILEMVKESSSVTKIASGYRLMARLYDSNPKLQIKYLDSAISYGLKSNYKYYPTSLYINKGASLSENGLFNAALENYLKALESAKNKNDNEYEFIIYHNIALLKRKLGLYSEAKYLFKKCLIHHKLDYNSSKNDSISYLETLAELVTTYRRNNEIDSATLNNNYGFNLSKDLAIKSLFKLNRGILKYYNNNFQNGIADIEDALISFNKPENKYFSENYNRIDAYFFLAELYKKVGDQERSLIYYKKVDSLIHATNYFVPEVRPSYYALINHYKSLGKKNEQLYYIDRLLRVDSILDQDYKNLSYSIIKGFDTPSLILEKERLIDDLKTRNYLSNYVILISFIAIFIISCFLIYNHKKKKIYKIRFQELMNKTKEESLIKNEKEESESIQFNIADEVVDKILYDLRKFEEGKEYKKINITSSKLSKLINTNSKYLTTVIKYKKKKNFTQYINDLRIENIIDELKEDKKLQNYTIKALAKESGFNSAEVFSKYFYKKTGIYPSYFIKKLQENENQQVKLL